MHLLFDATEASLFVLYLGCLFALEDTWVVVVAFFLRDSNDTCHLQDIQNIIRPPHLRLVLVINRVNPVNYLITRDPRELFDVINGHTGHLGHLYIILLITLYCSFLIESSCGPLRECLHSFGLIEVEHFSSIFDCCCLPITRA